MATKQKKWHEVDIDPTILADPVFETLSSFTETTDYTIVGGRIQIGKGKRSSKRVASEDDSQIETPRPKRAKKQTQKQAKDAKPEAKLQPADSEAVEVKKRAKKQTLKQAKDAKPKAKLQPADSEAVSVKDNDEKKSLETSKNKRKRNKKRSKKVRATAEKAGESQVSQTDGGETKIDEPAEAAAMDTDETKDHEADNQKQNTVEDQNEIDDEVSRNWANYFVPRVIVDALRRAKFAQPTQVQQLALPAAICARRDMIIAAETGSGKTLAYGIPLVAHILRVIEESQESQTTEATKTGTKLDRRNKCGLLACVITPTRELAVQVKRHIEAITACTSVRVALIVGGLDEHKQLRVLSSQPHIVVATPGRFWALLDDATNEHLNASSTTLRYLVIDEADRLIEDGHFEELHHILAHFNADETTKSARQNFVCSATLTFDPRTVATKRRSKLAQLCDRVGLRPNFKTVNLTPVGITASRLTECVAKCVADEKDVLTVWMLHAHVGRTLVFVNSKAALRRLVTLLRLVLSATDSRRKLLRLAANMEQKARLRNVEIFTTQPDAILVATDVAARGLDVPNVDYVLHYHVPASSETYVHRCGRTARSSNEGVSVLLVSPAELERYEKIVASLDRPTGLPKLEMGSADVDRWRAAVRFAETIASRQLADSRKQSDVRWLTSLANAADCELDEAMCADLGLEYDDDDVGRGSGNDNASRKQKKKQRRKLRLSQAATLDSMKKQLAQLLGTALTSSKRTKRMR